MGGIIVGVGLIQAYSFCHLSLLLRHTLPAFLDGFRCAGDERGLVPGQASFHVQVNFDLTPPTTKHMSLIACTY
jgi:hypothetical protein